ncbi:MAG TPA: hypothetical protein VGB83_02380 [Actinomycetota bacterium]
MRRRIVLVLASTLSLIALPAQHAVADDPIPIGPCALDDFSQDGANWNWNGHIGPENEDLKCTADVKYRLEFKVIKAAGLFTNWTDYKVRQNPSDGGFSSSFGKEIPEWDPLIIVEEEGIFKGRISIELKYRDGTTTPVLYEEFGPLDCEIRGDSRTDGCWPNLNDNP